MKPLFVEEMNEDDDVFYSCFRIAEDEFCNLIDFDPIFFYGKIIDEDAGTPFGQSVIDENKTYCCCSACGEIFELDTSENLLPSITCPKCKEEGILVNFRDRSQPLDHMYEQNIAYMATYEDGFVLRLFKAYADYSEREYDDYTKLSCFPFMRFFEYGREYYHDGQLKYFSNPLEDESDTQWVEVDNIDDNDFWLMNSAEEIVDDLCDSPYIIDLKNDTDIDKPLMYYLTKPLSYNAFRAIQKYGLKNILDSMIYAASEFPNSSKISKVLGVDFNQIIANVGEDIKLNELLSARKLYKLNVSPTIQNINLMIQMKGIEEIDGFKLTADNARKTFKYLRNQENKTKSEDVGRDYVDYLSECDNLAFNMGDSRVLYPTDLAKAHVYTASLLEIKENAETEAGVMKAYEKYHNLCSYDNGKLCVIMPQHCEEIILEGKLQSHCVGNYVERVAKGEDIILFVRRSAEKDKPFYTMEIRPIMRKLDMVQCRGYKNEDKSPEIRAEVDEFLAEYGNWFNQRKPVVEDNTARIFYKAVRKVNGKYISGWDNKTEYIIGQFLETVVDKDPDRVAVKGIHVASLEFAQRYGDTWDNVAILELEVDIQDIVVPNAKDQIRASRVKVLREIPFEEMGEWGAKRITKSTNILLTA